MVDLAQAAAWHRQVATLVLASDRVGLIATDPTGVAADSLPALRARLWAQEAQFTQVAARDGVPIPPLRPTVAQIDAAVANLTGVAIAALIQTATATLDAADQLLRAALAGSAQPAVPGPPSLSATPPPSAGPQIPTPPNPAPPSPTPPMPAPLNPAPVVPAPPFPTPSGPPFATTGPPPSAPTGAVPGLARMPAGVRNGLVYGICALAVAVIQGLLFVVIDEQTLPLLSPVCLLILPAFAWAIGWFTIGALFSPAPGESSVKRTPRLGLVICLVPDALLCAGVVVLGVLRLAGTA